MGADPTLRSDVYRTQVSRRNVRRIHSISDSTLLVTVVAVRSSYVLSVLRTACVCCTCAKDGTCTCLLVETLNI